MAKKQMSREGYEKLEQKLSYLITVRRAEVAQKLKEARSFGDLSENAEYDEAKTNRASWKRKLPSCKSPWKMRRSWKMITFPWTRSVWAPSLRFAGLARTRSSGSRS